MHFTAEQQEQAMTEYYAECLGCGREIATAVMGIKVHPDSQKFLNASAVRSSLWHHATYRSNWYVGLDEYSREAGEDILIHLGTREASLDRARTLLGKTLYTVKINPEATISPYVVEDDNTWPEGTGDLSVEGWNGYFGDVTRYVNRYEMPGSISLIVNYKMISIVEVETLDSVHVDRLQLV